MRAGIELQLILTSDLDRFAATTALFIPAILTRNALTVPYQRGRRVRALRSEPTARRGAPRHADHSSGPCQIDSHATALARSLAQALAPVLFGAVSDHVFGGGRTGLRWTFVVMLLPLGASAMLYLRGKTHVSTRCRLCGWGGPPARGASGRPD
jgi:hypothetical protein